MSQRPTARQTLPEAPRQGALAPLMIPLQSSCVSCGLQGSEGRGLRSTRSSHSHHVEWCLAPGKCERGLPIEGNESTNVKVSELFKLC